MRLHLTDAAVRSLKADRQTKIWDSATPGFGILIGARSKSWIVTHGADRRTKVLGRYPDISLSAARLSAKKIMLAEPVPSSLSVAEGVARFLEDAQSRTRARTSAGYRRLLTKHLVARFGARDLRGIAAQDVASIVDGLRRAPSEAAHVRTAISIFFAWCMGRSYADGNPARAIKAPGKKRARSRTLSDDELAKVWAAAGDLTIGRIARLCIVLGQRRSEIAKLEWDWIDGTKRIITFPALVMKNNVEHTIPFGEMAEQIFAEVPAVSEHLFPGRDRNDTWCGFARGKRDLDKASGVSDWTLHDLRRTYATNHARLGTPIHVTEKLLGHVSGTMGGIVGVYQRYNYWPEMVEATGEYEAWLAALVLAKPKVAA